MTENDKATLMMILFNLVLKSTEVSKQMLSDDVTESQVNTLINKIIIEAQQEILELTK